ncbi:MAG TPA: AAA family ATPase [Steroidobacteraceae bacterium]|nr:AAA family ATPase [Steroidobacteraceae bacterium]
MLATRLLIVTGLPATGKTTVAAMLAGRYGCALLAKDTIKESLLDTLSHGDVAWSRKLSDAAYAVTFSLARTFLASAVSVIVEGNFRAEHAAPLERLVSSSLPDLRVGQILCAVDEEQRLARLRARTHDPARHPGHLDAMGAAGSAAFSGSADFLPIRGAQWLLDCTHAQAEQSVLPALDRFWEGEG